MKNNVRESMKIYLKSASLKNVALVGISLIVAGAVFIWVMKWLPPEIGAGDFRPYWSSTYLFRMGQDYSSLAGMDQVERTMTGWSQPFTMMAWFAPTGNILLLPFTFLPFYVAARLWLLVNMAAVLLSAHLLWKNRVGKPWISYAVAISFSMTLVSFAVGQVNTFVLLGLALFLIFMKRGKLAAAGACLALVTIKPHLVILTLPLILLELTRKRQWLVLGSFFGVLAGLSALLFVIFPGWWQSFWQMVITGLDSFRLTPTLNGLLSLAGETRLGKWLWMPALFATAFVWYKNRKETILRNWIDVSIMIGLIVAPAGWSYDQIMLLIPSLHVVEWTQDGSLSRRTGILIGFLLISFNLATYVQRMVMANEESYFWVPWAAIAIYGAAYGARNKKIFLSPI